MIFWQRLKHLLPSHRRAQEREMREEFQSLSEIAGPGELGNMTRAAEDARAVWSWEWLDQLYRDLQYAFRTLRHNPGVGAIESAVQPRVGAGGREFLECHRLGAGRADGDLF